jgi:hypothetical protein
LWVERPTCDSGTNRGCECFAFGAVGDRYEHDGGRERQGHCGFDLGAFAAADAFFHVVQQRIDAGLADEQEFLRVNVEPDHALTCMAAMRE